MFGIKTYIMAITTKEPKTPPHHYPYVMSNSLLPSFSSTCWLYVSPPPTQKPKYAVKIQGIVFIRYYPFQYFVSLHAMHL